MNTTLKRTVYLGIAVLSVILFIVGSFYDLPIAQAVYRPNHPAALVFTVIGYYVFFGTFEIMTGTLCKQILNLTKSKVKRILILIVCSYTGLSTAVLGSMGLVSDSVLGLCFPDVTFTFWHSVFIGLIFLYPLVFLGMLLNGKRAEPSTVRGLLLLLCIMTVSFFGHAGFTALYSRPRFRITQQHRSQNKSETVSSEPITDSGEMERGWRSIHPLRRIQITTDNFDNFAWQTYLLKHMARRTCSDAF